MESALTPREIQARIRSGESLADVARAAGVSEEGIEPYAGPVIAEREHIVLLARTAPVRRRGETGSQRQLGDTIADRLAGHGIEAEQLTWDAWRNEDRRWTVQVSWPTDDDIAHAAFEFDQRGRFSVATDERARILIDEVPPPPQPRPGDPDAEPTVDLNDELAIVRVLQGDSEPPTVVPDIPSSRIIKLPSRDEPEVVDSDPDDYADVELAEVDGVYDIIPNPRGDMDVLYEMLAGFNEDSVRIYAGLTRPVAGPTEDEPVTDPVTETAPATEPAEDKPRPERRSRARQRREPSSDDPPPGLEQDPLVPDEQPTPRPKQTRRKRRAQVPSWDEIMFGGPQEPTK